MPFFPQAQNQTAPYAVGNRVYGGGMPQPTLGPVDRMGYKERDLQTKARRDAILRRLKANNVKDFASADAQRVI